MTSVGGQFSEAQGCDTLAGEITEGHIGWDANNVAGISRPGMTQAEGEASMTFKRVG